MSVTPGVEATNYARPFRDKDYRQRVATTKKAMAEQDLDVLICTDPCNMNYLSGYDGWTFHMPQCLIVGLEEDEPIWIGRETEYFQARITSMLRDESLRAYPEKYFISCFKEHAFDFVSEVLRERGLAKGRIGIESQTYLMCAKAYQCLVGNLPDAAIVDAQWLVDRIRAIKSNREIEYMDQAARILESAMAVAIEKLEPGTRQCDLAAAITSAQIEGVDDYHGDYPSVVPLMATGIGTAAPHLTWTSQRYVTGEATTIEIAGCRHRYHVPMGRTVFLGTPPQKMVDAEKYIVSGVHAALDAARPGAVCEDVEMVWRKEISGSHVVKPSRLGYSIGLGYPPDWCGNQMSFYPGDRTELLEGMTFHLMPGVWMDGWGLEISEPFHVTESGARPFANVTRDLIVKG